MGIDCRNQNCYNCRHLARNFRNRGIGNRIREKRRLEYRGNKNNGRIEGGQNNKSNLNGKGDLIVFN